jgi:uroporphyrinogen-III synthase
MRGALEGAGIVVTRPAGAHDKLARLLAADGARVLPFPALRITPLDEPVPAGPFDAVLFTSPTAVHHAPSRLEAKLPPLRLAPGEGTRKALASASIEAVLAPQQGAGLAALLAELPPTKLVRKRLLVVCGKPVNQASIEALRERGAEPVVLPTYRRESMREAHPLDEWLASDAVDVIMASSTAAVDAMNTLANIDLRERLWIASSARVAEAIHSGGGRVAALATSAEAHAMQAAVRGWWRQQKSGDRP